MAMSCLKPFLALIAYDSEGKHAHNMESGIGVSGWLGLGGSGREEMEITVLEQQ